MKQSNLLSLSKLITILLFLTSLQLACTPKKVSSNTGDNKVYNDDSEIIMKSTEKKAKMPFDTSSAPRIERKVNNLETQ